MAKKKSSAKKAVKKTIKKVVKKTASKVVKKASKKSPVKKASAKKAAVKKAVAKPVKKSAAAKTAPKKSAKTPAKKSSATKSTSPAIKPAMKPAASKKAVDLTDFVTPLDDRLLVQTSDAERTTASGLLYIPDTVADVSGNFHGTVVAVGRGHISKKGHLRPMELKVGDKVVFSQYSGSKIKIQNEDLVILRETEVMGVVEK